MGASVSTPVSPPETKPAADGCPVDHKTREIWLAQNKNASPHNIPSQDSKERPAKLQRPLSTDREVSSIPRALPSSKPVSEEPPPPTSPYAQQPAVPVASHGIPSNAESETGADGKTGNWIYPSERQFFDAVLRKNNTPSSTKNATELATSVASIIPIHNAVNERAWAEILDWESKGPTSDPGSKKCGGPKLYSFRGLGAESQYLSPRARWNGFLGYQLPFDRHDWVVERCDGARLEYVIDFYQGKSNQRGDGGKLNFFLDVRPKLNSWEGIRMRASRFVGL
ncbi:cytochrome c1 heme lyase [Nannizzia gypsea CBS 118893]|uniref:Holocytochrome c-type synthase n=1 Tax=Arthroderma gypseum (strain ATCC MYA-4604 / CBS 118893) TaxID=535722 RepID=E5R326_ARTGP|nr:cytochrome c1 heme lyase [Nannizzia gypsea CBS 118893]EFQ98730.1 cytochrome c1 heme lyase [Nannizzia gypsea CBS 118893]